MTDSNDLYIHNAISYSVATSFSGPFAAYFYNFCYMPRKMTLVKQNENHAIFEGFFLCEIETWTNENTFSKFL